MVIFLIPNLLYLKRKISNFQCFDNETKLKTEKMLGGRKRKGGGENNFVFGEGVEENI
jgi:hypothetical protein